MTIDTAYYMALNLATDDDGLIDDSAALSWFYRLLSGVEKIQLH